MSGVILSPSSASLNANELDCSNSLRFVECMESEHIVKCVGGFRLTAFKANGTWSIFCGKLKRMEADLRFHMLQAADTNDIEGFLSCIQDDIDLDIKDTNGQTALIIASERGHLDIVTEILAHNINIDLQDDDGWTALIAASKEGHADVVTRLLEHGAKVDIVDVVYAAEVEITGGWSPLIWASYKGHYEVVKTLLYHSADPNERGKHNMTALIWASGRGHVEVVEELIKYDAKVEVADKYGTSALIWASRKGHYQVIDTLLHNGANCNVSGSHGWTPLIMAAKGGYIDVVVLLLEENPNVNAVDQDGRSALSWSAKEGFNDIVTKLIQKGAFLNMPDKNGDSPLILSASEGHCDVVKTLVNAYADIELTQGEGKSALYIAVEKGHVQVVNELLSSGANTEVTTKGGETALLCGVMKNHTHCVKLLIEKGANLHTTDKKGDTVLHIAIRNHHSGLSAMLLNDQRTTKLLHQRNKAGETPYTIDSFNKPSILPGLFTGNQFSQSDFEKMDVGAQQELFTSTFSEFLVEPSLTIPVTVGIYSRWGAGKSEFLHSIMNHLREFKEQSPIEPFTITMPTVIMCLVIAISCGLLIWPMSGSWPAGIAAAICLTIILLLLLSFARLALVSTDEKLHRYGMMLTNHLKRIAWFLRLVYSLPNSIEDIRHVLPVHIITVDLSQAVAVGDNPMTSLVNFTKALNNAVEDDLGIVIPRLYRIFQVGPYRARTGALQRLRSRWKTSCCCIPSFIITIIVILCFWFGIILFHNFDEQADAARGLQIVCCCIVGCSLLINLLRLVVMIYCMALPMKKRVKIVSTQYGMQEDTFLTVMKQEFDIFVDMLECIDGFARRQTRIVIKLDLLDSLEQQKILSLINAINLLVTEPGHPFILLLSVDPRLLIKAVDQTLATMPGPIINPREYLKNLIDLPFYVSEQSRFNYDGLIPADVCNQLEEQRILDFPQNDLEWDGDGEILVSAVHSVENGNVPSMNGGISTVKSQRSVTFPSTESLNKESGDITENISHLLRNNEHETLADVKRVMNIVSLNGRILRNSEIHFQWTRLAVWVCLCDGWPYKANWITLLCLDTSLDLPEKMSIKSLYLLLGYCMPSVSEIDSNSENSTTFFDTFIATHKPSLSVGDVRKFSPFMFCIDPTVRKLMVDYLVAMKSGSISKQPSLINHQITSSRSNYPLSPGSSSKFMWRSTFDDIFLARMTVEDVANQLIDIEGIEEVLLPLYKGRIHENNINGRVLIQCDLNELREVMQMKFGDWQLFKAWILGIREKEAVPARSVDKASSYRSSSRNMSYGECSQTESIPDSPKVIYSQTQGATRLPALSETSTGNIPYTSHSPRSTPPQQTRKPTKHGRIISKNGKSISQDSESCSSPLKEQTVDPKWHRSADSGFASTDVDPLNKLLNSQNNGSRRVSNTSEKTNEPVAQTKPGIHLEASSKRNSSSDRLPSYKELYNDTWVSKTELGLGHIYKVSNDVLSSGSSEYVAIDIDDQKTWKFAKISDTEEEQIEVHDLTMDGVQGQVRKERAPSLSEVPLPPLSMLNDTAEWELNPPTDFADTHDENDNLPPSPVAIQRKKAFHKQFNRGMTSTNYATTSTESEQLLASDTGSLTGSTKSEPNVKIIRGSRSSLKKSASNENGFKKRKMLNSERNGESTQTLLRQESKF